MFGKSHHLLAVFMGHMKLSGFKALEKKLNYSTVAEWVTNNGLGDKKRELD